MFNEVFRKKVHNAIKQITAHIKTN